MSYIWAFTITLSINLPSHTNSHTHTHTGTHALTHTQTQAENKAWSQPKDRKPCSPQTRHHQTQCPFSNRPDRLYLCSTWETYHYMWPSRIINRCNFSLLSRMNTPTWRNKQIDGLCVYMFLCVLFKSFIDCLGVLHLFVFVETCPKYWNNSIPPPSAHRSGIPRR